MLESLCLVLVPLSNRSCLDFLTKLLLGLVDLELHFWDRGDLVRANFLPFGIRLEWDNDFLCTGLEDCFSADPLQFGRTSAAFSGKSHVGLDLAVLDVTFFFFFDASLEEDDVDEEADGTS